MQEDSIEVVHSEDGGNGLPPTAPSEPTSETVVPTETEPAAPAEPVAELYELPDGRKVDAETLTREWKENFLPDYTRKSQALAQASAKTLPESKPASPLADPDFIPKTYAELAEHIQAQTLQTLEQKEQQRVAEQKAIEDQVNGQLTEIKKADPALNENELFLHANKYGFRDLLAAHQNMKDMKALAKNVQQTTAKNVAKRADPVSSTPGATGARPDPGMFSSARDYLRSLKN